METRTIKVKVVPNASPNDPGVWKELTLPAAHVQRLMTRKRFATVASELEEYLGDPSHHIVMYRLDIG